MGRVQFNIRNIHVAPITSIAADGTITYGNVLANPGARSFTIDPGSADKEVFYADGEEYFVQNGSTAQEAELVVARIIDEIRKSILGEQVDGDGDYWENENDVNTEFALGFSIDGNEKKSYFWYQRVSAGKPSQQYDTDEENKTVMTETLPLTVKPNRAGNIRVRRDSVDDISATWFAAVKSVPTPIVNATKNVVKKEEE